MSIEDIKKLLRLNNIFGPNVKAIMKAQKELQDLQFFAHPVNTAYFSFIDLDSTTTAARIVRGTPILWDVFYSASIVDQASLQRYSSVLHTIPTGFDGWIEYFDNSTKIQLQETEYEFTPKINEKETNIIEDVESILVNDSKRIQQIITDIYYKNIRLLDLEPRQFEELIAELMRRQGFQVELTKQTRDGGYDILAMYPIKSQARQKWIVECKRYSEHRKIDVNIVRSFKDVVMTEGANRGLIVTTSYFSDDAKKKKDQTPYLLDFRDKNDVMEWVMEYRASSD